MRGGSSGAVSRRREEKWKVSVTVEAMGGLEGARVLPRRMVKSRLGGEEDEEVIEGDMGDEGGMEEESG